MVRSDSHLPSIERRGPGPDAAERGREHVAVELLARLGVDPALYAA